LCLSCILVVDQFHGVASVHHVTRRSFHISLQISDLLVLDVAQAGRAALSATKRAISH